MLAARGDKRKSWQRLGYVVSITYGTVAATSGASSDAAEQAKRSVAAPADGRCALRCMFRQIIVSIWVCPEKGEVELHRPFYVLMTDARAHC